MRVTLSFPWWTSTWAKEERAALLAPLNYTVIVVAARVEEDVGVRVAGTSLNLTWLMDVRDRDGEMGENVIVANKYLVSSVGLNVGLHDVFVVG